MAKYQGLNPIMGEITFMASNEKNPQHEQHLYDIFSTVEKFVRVAVPQLVADYLDEFQQALTVEIETFLNGSPVHQKDLTQTVANLIQNAIGKAKVSITL